MSWINCNKCGVIKTPSNPIELFCGSCSHVLCAECNRLPICPLDNRPFKGIQINHSMPEKLRVYFEDPCKLLTPWQKCIRFQFEQRSLCEPLQFVENLKKTRQFRQEIKLLGKAKEVLEENMDKNVKRNNKMKEYIKYLLQKRTRRSRRFAPSTASTSMSLNFSSVLGESGVDLQFDDLNFSN